MNLYINFRRMLAVWIVMSVSALGTLRVRWGSESGQSEWVGQIMILGIILLIAAVVFAFWKGGGGAWVNSQLSSITTY